MRPQCLKCNSTNIEIERRPNGHLRCLDCRAVWTRQDEDQSVIRDLREQLEAKGAFCGFCKTAVPGGSWEQLQAHIRTCKQHPMHALLVESQKLLERFDDGHWAAGEPGLAPGFDGLREAVRRATDG